MSKERSRPWHNPTPLPGFTPVWAGQFDTFDDWVSHASRALTGEKGSVGEELKPFCVDALGRRCHNGKDFMRARDQGTFPVRYFFEGTVSKIEQLPFDDAEPGPEFCDLCGEEAFDKAYCTPNAEGRCRACGKEGFPPATTLGTL